MSLYPEYEHTGYFFSANYSDSTRMSEFTDYTPANADFTCDVFLIRLSAADAIISGEEYGDYRANIGGANRSLIEEGQVMLWNNNLYIVKNKPKPLNIFPKVRVYFIDYEQDNA